MADEDNAYDDDELDEDEDDDEYEYEDDEDEDEEEERLRAEQEEAARVAKEKELQRLEIERLKEERRAMLLEMARESRRRFEVEVSAVLGGTNLPMSNLLKVGRGAVIELDTTVNDLIDIQVNSKPVAKGEVLVVDEHLAVSVVALQKS